MMVQGERKPLPARGFKKPHPAVLILLTKQNRKRRCARRHVFAESVPLGIEPAAGENEFRCFLFAVNFLKECRGIWYIHCVKALKHVTC